MKEIAVDKIRDLLDDIIKDKKTIVKIMFIILILLVAVILRIAAADRSSVNVETAEAASVESEESTADIEATTEVWVDICGQVTNPGVYQVSEGTRLYQLIELAGGLTENADTDSINRASFVEDGEKIIIPAKTAASEKKADQSSSSTETGSSAAIDRGGLVNINYASKEELMTLSGIGDVTAEKIIEYRKSNRFRKKEDIKSVKGIGDATFEKIKDSITC